MSTNLNEVTQSLVNRQNEQIEQLTKKLESAQRSISHYEHIIKQYQENYQNYQVVEMERIKATSDFIKRESKYLQTIKNLSDDKKRLEAEVNKSKEESKVQIPVISMRQLHLTPSYSSIRSRESNVLSIHPIHQAEKAKPGP